MHQDLQLPYPRLAAMYGPGLVHAAAVGGVLLLVAPVLVRRDRWTEWSFRLTYLCSVLVFCVIFNHQSESPTFVIAVAGAAIWFAALERPSRAEWALFGFLVVCTILASSDAMPRTIQRTVFDRYHFKTVPCIVLWVVLQQRLWRHIPRPPTSVTGKRATLDGKHAPWIPVPD